MTIIYENGTLKLSRSALCMNLYQICSSNSILCRTPVAIATKTEKHEIFKKLISKTLRPTAMIFGMWHLFVVMYQDGINNASLIRKSHTLEVGSLTYNFTEKQEKYIFSKTTRPRT